VSDPPSLDTPPLGIAVPPVLAVVLVELNVADDDPLAEKSQASAGAASATEATAASIILLNCFITLLKFVMRLVRDPTIRIFKTLNTAAVTTMVFQPATAPGDAPENPRHEPQLRDSAPSGPNAACGE